MEAAGHSDHPHHRAKRDKRLCQSRRCAGAYTTIILLHRPTTCPQISRKGRSTESRRAGTFSRLPGGGKEGSAMSNIEIICQQLATHIKHEMESRSYVAANELRNAELLVLRGQRGGRIYTVPGTKAKYQASAPGQPPAVRTGAFRLSWQPSAHVVFGSYISRIESDLQVGSKRMYNLGELLEGGTSKMAPRPHQDKILETAEPNIVKIYSRDYF